MSEMIEQVARALHRAANDTSWPPEDGRHEIAWMDLPEAWREDFRVEARAAISAIRPFVVAACETSKGYPTWQSSAVAGVIDSALARTPAEQKLDGSSDISWTDVSPPAEIPLK